MKSRRWCKAFSDSSFQRAKARPRIPAARNAPGSCEDHPLKRHLTFEHARPINVMYQMLRDEKATLTLVRAAVIIGEYPLVLVTAEEEMRMAKLGFMHGGVPAERYAHIPISGFSLRSGVAAAKAVCARGG
jgi:hypothetical protein